MLKLCVMPAKKLFSVFPLLFLAGCAISAPAPQASMPTLQASTLPILGPGCHTPDAATSDALWTLIPKANNYVYNSTVVQVNATQQIVSYLGDSGVVVYLTLTGSDPSTWQDISDEPFQDDRQGDDPALSDTQNAIYAAATQAWACALGA